MASASTSSPRPRLRSADHDKLPTFPVEEVVGDEEERGLGSGGGGGVDDDDGAQLVPAVAVRETRIPVPKNIQGELWGTIVLAWPVLLTCRATITTRMWCSNMATACAR